MFVTKRYAEEKFKEGRDLGIAQTLELNEKIEAANRKKDKEIKKLQETIGDKDNAIMALEDLRLKDLELKKKEIKLAQQESELEANIEALEANIKANEGKEDMNYKKGYSDGIADGLREVGKITAKDRENSMKVAMIAASSHTPVANLKEINNAHQITAGTSN